MGFLLYSLDWIYVALLIAVAAIDICTHKIDSRIVSLMFVIVVVNVILEVVASGMYLTSVWAALISGTFTAFVFWGIHRITHGIGLGDVKLMAAVGFFYSIQGIFTIVFFSMFLVAVVGLIMVVKNRNNLKAELPFAPFVAAAAIVREVILLTDIL